MRLLISIKLKSFTYLIVLPEKVVLQGGKYGETAGR